jgi:hypothetical protein
MAKSKLELAKRRLSNMRARGQEMAETAVGIVTGTVTSTALGYGRGRVSVPTAPGEKPKDEFGVGGVPAEMITAAAGHLLGFMGVAGKSSYILHAVGQAGLDCYGYLAGIELGQKARTERDKKAAAETVGAVRGRT